MNIGKGFILIADDDSEDQELLIAALLNVDPNCRVTTVFDGNEALEYLAGRAAAALPGAIVLDYSMPKLNGAQVLKVLCLDERYKSIPKFVWSTSHMPAYVQECLDNGATDYIVKPDDPDKLDAFARRLLDACAGYSAGR